MRPRPVVRVGVSKQGRPRRTLPRAGPPARSPRSSTSPPGRTPRRSPPRAPRASSRRSCCAPPDLDDRQRSASRRSRVRCWSTTSSRSRPPATSPPRARHGGAGDGGGRRGQRRPGRPGRRGGALGAAAPLRRRAPRHPRGRGQRGPGRRGGRLRGPDVFSVEPTRAGRCAPPRRGAPVAGPAGPRRRRPASALVAVRPSTGDLLAVASGPAAAAWARRRRAATPPGRRFKVVTSLALLRAGLTPASAVSCPTTLTVDGKVFENYDDYRPTPPVGSPRGRGGQLLQHGLHRRPATSWRTATWPRRGPRWAWGWTATWGSRRTSAGSTAPAPPPRRPRP